MVTLQLGTAGDNMVIIENKSKFTVFLLYDQNETCIESNSSVQLSCPKGSMHFSLLHKKNSYYRFGTFHIFVDTCASFISTTGSETFTISDFEKYNGINNVLYAFSLKSSVEECDFIYFVQDEALLIKRYGKNQKLKSFYNIVSELFISVVSAAGFYLVIKTFFPEYKIIIFLFLIVLWLIISLFIGFLIKRILKKSVKKQKNAEEKDETDFYNCFNPVFLNSIINQQIQ